MISQATGIISEIKEVKNKSGELMYVEFSLTVSQSHNNKGYVKADKFKVCYGRRDKVNLIKLLKEDMSVTVSGRLETVKKTYNGKTFNFTCLKADSVKVNEIPKSSKAESFAHASGMPESTEMLIRLPF